MTRDWLDLAARYFLQPGIINKSVDNRRKYRIDFIVNICL
jgi:hypothetical protein